MTPSLPAPALWHIDDLTAFLRGHWWIFLLVVALLIIFFIRRGIDTRNNYDPQWYQDTHETNQTNDELQELIDLEENKKARK